MMTYLCNVCGTQFEVDRSYGVKCDVCDSDEVIAQPFEDISEENSFDVGGDWADEI